MHNKYFPVCTVNGDIEPTVPYKHMGIGGNIPNKCSKCSRLFEGECLRGIDSVGRYLNLDYGPCHINGPTDPVVYDNEFLSSKVTVPRKCTKCVFLNYKPIYGFICESDKDKWGGWHRGLDWGNWKPDSIYIELPYPKVTSRELHRAALDGNEIEFLKEYRRINPGSTFMDAKEKYKWYCDKLKGS
jgi:hypothetical protein